MIPVEKIAGGTLGNLLYYVAIIGVLLVICTIIRLMVFSCFIPPKSKNSHVLPHSRDKT